MDRAEEDRLIGQVVDRLRKSFPDVPAHTVVDVVGAVLKRFEHARIREFLPLFVERSTKEKLAVLDAGV